MALEFTSIPDRHGPAVYILHNHSARLAAQFTRLAEEIDALTPDETQVCLLEPSRGDGLAVKEFYGLTVFPVVMIILDDDTVYQMWVSDIPRPDEVSYALSTINGTMRAS